MEWTREHHDAAFARAKVEFLEVDDDNDPLAIAFANLSVTRFSQLLMLTYNSVENMQYQPLCAKGGPSWMWRLAGKSWQ